MPHKFELQTEAINSEDINMLHGTLAKWCGEQHIEVSDSRAQAAAVELIDWFQFGVKSEDQLIEMLRRGSPLRAV
ncbi:hypothetical protein [Rhizobium herbae]